MCRRRSSAWTNNRCMMVDDVLPNQTRIYRQIQDNECCPHEGVHFWRINLEEYAVMVGTIIEPSEGAPCRCGEKTWIRANSVRAKMKLAGEYESGGMRMNGEYEDDENDE